MDNPLSFEKIINGRKIALIRQKRLMEFIPKLPAVPTVVSILIGDDPPSILYTQMKQKKAQEVGVDFQYIRYEKSESFETVAMTILKLNQDPKVRGIMIQLPLPKEFLQGKSADTLLKRINPEKDVDGLTGKGKYLPAAVKAVMVILEEEKIDIKNKFAAVLGTSRLVGQPIAQQLKLRGAMVSPINTSTTNKNQILKHADLVVSATGVAKVLTGDMVKNGVVVIDVGTLVIEDELSDAPKQVVGDVDFDSVAPKASRITPVPGGVGPLTVISLLENVVEAATPLVVSQQGEVEENPSF